MPNDFFLRLFKRFSFLYELILKPRAPHEDDARREFILNLLLLVFLALFGCLFFINAFSAASLGSGYYGSPPEKMMIPLTVLLLLLFFSRVGFSKLIAILFVWGLYALVVYALFTWGLGLPQAWLFCALVISFAAILIGTGYSFIITLSLCIAFFFILFGEQSGSVAPDLSWQTRPFVLADVIGAVATFFVFTIVSWLSNREITRSLVRARTSEQLLKEERDNLEIKVEERTRDLVKEQEARLHEVERFAEFGQLASGILHPA